MTSKSKKDHLISVITVNYNGLELTAALIESIGRARMDLPVEIIVVDNGSRDDEAAILAQRYPHIKAIRSQENLGFAGGNNLGIKAAKGDLLFFLNNDTEIGAGRIIGLADYLDYHSKVGVACPKICFFQPPHNVQFAGYTPLSKVTLRNSLIGFNQEDGMEYAQAAETPYAHGAAMMVRRSVIEEAGMMPEMYFLYYEELDWSVRIREAGYAIVYVPSLTIFHKESATTGQNSPLRTYYITRNRLVFACRNLHGVYKPLSVAYQLLLALPKSVAVNLLHGNLRNAWAVVRGANDFYKCLHQ